MASNIDHLTTEIGFRFTKYMTLVNDTIRRQTDASMERLVSATKATAPVGRRKKHYKNSITSYVTRDSAVEYERTWCVKAPDYRLSHLLEDGHMLRNGGRYGGTHFIRKAAVPILEDYYKAIEEGIERDR